MHSAAESTGTRVRPDRRAWLLAWRAALVCLALAAATIWHISLFWIFRDAPAVMAGVLAGVFGLVIGVRTIARNVHADARTYSMAAAARLNGIGLAFIACLLVLLALFHVGFERAAADGRSYFIQVRSIVMDRDLDFSNDEAVFGSHGADQYPIGAALLWSPFFVAGHAWVRASELFGADVRTDGYYYPYQRAVGLATLFYGFAGLVLAYRVVRAYFPRGIAALSTLGLCLTSFLLWYLTVENSMVHGVSMFVTTLFLFLWHRMRLAPTTRRWAGLGVAAGLMTLVRWQNGLFVIFAVVDLLWQRGAARDGQAGTRASRIPDIARHLAAFALTGALAFAPQLIAWHVTFGDWTHVPATEHAFSPALVPPYLVDVLFSSNRGLLTWSPVLWAAVMGLAVFTWRHPRVGLVLIAGFLAQLWVNAGVDTWWGGAGFGARRFANCTLVFAMGLAGMLAALERRPLLLPTIGLAGLLLVNGIFMRDYDRRALGIADGVTFDEFVTAAYDRMGNPLSLPVGAYLAWRYDVSPTLYDRQRGRTYSDLTVDVGGAGDEQFLGHGWSIPETQGTLTYRWADAETSTVLVPLTSPTGDYVLELEWAPLPETGLGRQIVWIELNGEEVAIVRLEEGVQEDVVQLPAALLKDRLNHLRFRYQFAVSPESLGLSQDSRRLAVLVSRLRLRPAQPN